ncbi:hypothetical protein DFP72DRAFT_929880 [Ephemerocybe angulata]|uniref:DUF6533 domain-containing protein n=1 Tax=Ephemerocybe angulata TaxID=980116 RepID=A0A8H6HC46_9AGAR|nr:hypothetical protein DFP72DRAFT_929880 [Tulosesus angulatus]
MDLSPEELSDVITLYSTSAVLERILLGFYAFNLYYYVTTFGGEVSAIWALKWKTGKVLFLIARYGPTLYIPLTIISGFRNYLTMGPEVCKRLQIADDVSLRVCTMVSELILILCLHALLGSKRRYLALMLVLFAAFTVAITVPQIRYIEEAAHAIELSQADREFGYPCTWEGVISPEVLSTAKAAGYVSFTKTACLFLLTLAVFYVRYRKQTGSLLEVVRRDSGLCILLLTAIRLFNAITDAFNVVLGLYNIPDMILQCLQKVVIPILACRLLLNMQEHDDPGVRSTVSTLMFEAQSATTTSVGLDVDYDDEFTQVVEFPPRYAGLGRQVARNAEDTHGVPETQSRAQDSVHCLGGSGLSRV